jgi:hypothetical protein
MNKRLTNAYKRTAIALGGAFPKAPWQGASLTNHQCSSR